MSLAERIARVIASGPHVHCPLCGRPRVKLMLMVGYPEVVLEIHDVPSQEVVFNASEHPGEDVLVSVRCPASSQPVTEVP